MTTETDDSNFYLANAKHWLAMLEAGVPNPEQCIGWMLSALDRAGSTPVAIGVTPEKLTSFTRHSARAMTSRYQAAQGLSDYHLRALTSELSRAEAILAVTRHEPLAA